MSGRALTYVAEFIGTDGDAEVRKSTHWTPYWESIGSAFFSLRITKKELWWLPIELRELQ
jgi:hypothetical protein